MVLSMAVVGIVDGIPVVDYYLLGSGLLPVLLVWLVEALLLRLLEVMVLVRG